MKKITGIFSSIIFLSLGLLVGCSTTGAGTKNDATTLPAGYIPTANAASTSVAPSSYVIQPNDELSIKFFYNPELNEDVVVRPDGKISLQLVDDIQASGRTPAELDKELTRLYSAELKQPAITVIMRSFGSQQIFVGGEVGKPQAITLTPQMTPLQAVMNAGGFVDTADKQSVTIIRAGANNQAQTYNVNLDEIADASPDMGFKLQAGDVVYVPKTGIAKADVWMDQYVVRFLLFRGFTYSLRR